MNSSNKLLQISGSELSSILTTGLLIDNKSQSLIKDFRLDGGVVIDEVAFFGMVSPSTVLPVQHRVVIRNCRFDNSVFKNFQFLTVFDFQNCEFDNFFNFDCFSQGVKFIGCTINANANFNLKGPFFTFENSTIAGHTTILGTTHELNLKSCKSAFVQIKAQITRVHITEGAHGVLHIEGTDIAALYMGRVSVKAVELQGKVREIVIEKADIAERLIIKNSAIRTVNLRKCTGQGIIQYLPGGVETFRSELIFMTGLELFGELPSGHSLTISSSKLGRLTFENFKSFGTTRISSVKLRKRGVLVLRESDLENTSFLRCSFENNLMEFENTRLTKMFVSETDFPRLVTLSGKQHHGQARLAYGQLQSVFSAMGDNIRSSEYLAREVEAFYKSISFQTHFADKSSLFLNKISNDFGRSWIKALIFSLLTGFLLYQGFLFFSNRFGNFCICRPFPAGLDSFLLFMNPLRHFETERLLGSQQAVKLPPLAYVSDFLGRVVVAYGYYQLIQAFRKYGKK